MLQLRGLLRGSWQLPRAPIRWASAPAEDDVHRRLQQLQQRRGVQLLSPKRTARPAPSPPPLKSTPPPPGSNSSGNRPIKFTPGQLIGTFVAFVSTGIVVKLLFGNEDEEPEPVKVEPPPPRRIPLSSSEIPDKVPYLLVGGGTASFAALRAIRTAEPEAQVLVIAGEPHLPYMRPPLSKEMLAGDGKAGTLRFRQWNGSTRSVFYEPEEFYVTPASLEEAEHGGVAVARGWKVKSVDPYAKEVLLEDGKIIRYNKCLLATGSQPKVPPTFSNINPAVKDKVVFYRGLDDLDAVEAAAMSGGPVAIVGNGFLGSELAAALARRGATVTQLFREDAPLTHTLPGYLATAAASHLSSAGVRLRPRTAVETVDPASGDRVRLKLRPAASSNVAVDEVVDASLVVVAAGAAPDISLAKAAGLEVDDGRGGVTVNAQLAAATDLYAAGDVASFYDPALGRRRVEHHDHAVVSGRLAGENMTGARKPYSHQPMFWSDLGPDLGFEAVGLVDATLPTVGVFPKTTEESAENKSPDSYDRGVVFYLRDNIVVGVLLWNLFNRVDVARLVLKEQRPFEDLNEVAKLFNIHNIKEKESEKNKESASAEGTSIPTTPVSKAAVA